MMSLATIRELSRDAGNQARQNRRKPYHPESIEDLNFENLRAIPNLGDFTPVGWEKTETEWFVDHSGWGQEGEPALTIDQFVRAVKAHFATHPTAGYAITEVGQFQLYVTAFEYVGKSAMKGESTHA